MGILDIFRKKQPQKEVPTEGGVMDQKRALDDAHDISDVFSHEGARQGTVGVPVEGSNQVAKVARVRGEVVAAGFKPPEKKG